MTTEENTATKMHENYHHDLWLTMAREHAVKKRERKKKQNQKPNESDELYANIKGWQKDKSTITKGKKVSIF